MESRPINHYSFGRFLKLLKSLHIFVQLLFQFSKVCDSIQLIALQNFQDLGGIAESAAADFLSYIEGKERERERPSRDSEKP